MSTRKDTILERLARIETKIDAIQDKQKSLHCLAHTTDIQVIKRQMAIANRDRKWLTAIVGVVASVVSAAMSFAMEYIKKGL